jgi:ubiquinone/menaquinone biosynthesis C-methylase UbiE
MNLILHIDADEFDQSSPHHIRLLPFADRPFGRLPGRLSFRPIPWRMTCIRAVSSEGTSAVVSALSTGRRPVGKVAVLALQQPVSEEGPDRVSVTRRRLGVNPSDALLKKRVQNFWQNSPCDSWFTQEKRGTREFYQSLDDHRYKVHPQLISALKLEKACGMRVLEIGCGCGSEAERFARNGAHYTAVDLTNIAVSLTQRRFQLANLQGRFVQCDAENLPFADGSFDVVYSHGVLHHTPDTPRTIREVYRVLADCGSAMVMLYYRNSFNYQVNLRVVRRLRACLLRTQLGAKLARRIGSEEEDELRRHAELVQQDADYLEMQSVLNRNTDGPDNPLSQVFSRKSASKLFCQFKDVRTQIMFWNPNWLPGIGKLLPRWMEDALAARWGWHLWIYAEKGQPKPATERVLQPFWTRIIHLHSLPSFGHGVRQAYGVVARTEQFSGAQTGSRPISSSSAGELVHIRQ